MIDIWRRIRAHGYVCYLCGRYLGSTELRVEMVEDGHPIRCPMPVHTECWSTVKDPPGYEASKVWWKQFIALLNDFSPYLSSIPYPKDSVWPEKQFGERDKRDRLPVVQKCPVQPCALPIDIIHMIYDYLDSYEDVMNFQEAVVVEPLSAFWLHLGRRFLILANFKDGTQTEISQKIQRAFRTIHHDPARFPQAVNFSAIWSNAQQALTQMSNWVLGENSDLAPGGLYYPHNVLIPKAKSQKYMKATCPFNSKSDIRLRFNHVGGRLFLCGVSVGELTSGYIGDHAENVGQDICGLRLISSYNAFESIQVKGPKGWETKWHGSPPTQSHKAILSEITWDPNDDGRLLLQLDAFKICDIDFLSSTGTRSYPVAWRPPIYLQPQTSSITLPSVCDYDGISRGETKISARKWFQSERLKTVTAIGACVSARDYRIMRLTFYEEKSVTHLGDLTYHNTPLKFCLGQGEEIVAVAYGGKSHGIQFITNRERSVVFGQKDDDWDFKPVPDGIWCSSTNTRGHRDTLSEIGFLYNYGREAEFVPTIPNLQVTHWPKGVFAHCCNVFLSKASLESVSGVTIYMMQNHILGIQITHHDDASGSEYLGRALQGARTESFAIEGDIQSICAHYAPPTWESLSLVGLYIKTSTGQCIEVGDVTSFPQTFLQPCSGQQNLYCYFEGAITYLSLSGKDWRPSFPMQRPPVQRPRTMLYATMT